MLYIMWAAILAICILSYVKWGSWISPSATFSLGFLICCSWAVAYSDIWELGLHFNTFCVIIGGLFTFFFIGILISLYYSRTQKPIIEGFEPIAIKIEDWKLIIVIFFELLGLIVTAREMMNAAGSNNLTYAMHYYNTITKFSDETIVFSHGRLIEFFWVNAQALGYWFGYIFANNLLLRKFSLLPFIIIILSVANCLLRGARTNAFYMAAVILCYYVFLLKKSNPNKFKKVRIKIIVIIAIILVLFVASFKQIGLLMGRTITSSAMDYVSMYVGAEIKNLDTFLQNIKHSDRWGEQTFLAMYSWFKPYLGITEKLQLDLPDRYINGIWLGNVCTTFYPYVYDFGYIGVPILTGVMSIICHITYEKARRSKFRRYPIYSIVLYGFFWSSLALSFFSNKFYERSFSRTFVRILICWFFYKYIFCKLKFKTSKRYRKVSTTEFRTGRIIE